MIRQEQDYLVADSPADLEGMEILHREDWNEGSWRYHTRRRTRGNGWEFNMVYVPKTGVERLAGAVT